MGARPVFVAAAIGLLLLALDFRRRLAKLLAVQTRARHGKMPRTRS
jgi:hypothetical protein